MVALVVAGKGRWLTGTGMLVVTYAASLLIVERLFRVVKPKLMMMGWFGRVLLNHRLFPGLEIVDSRLYGISASAVSAHQAVSSNRFGAIAHRPTYRRCAGRQKR